MNTLQGAEHLVLAQRIADGARPTSCDERGPQSWLGPLRRNRDTESLDLLQVLLLTVYFARGCAGPSLLRKKHRREIVEPHDSLERSKRRGWVGDEFARTRFVSVTPSQADGLREYSTMIYAVAATCRKGL